MRFDNVVKIYRPNTTSRSYMTEMDGLRCVHYGDIYKNYTGRELKSSDIINSISIEFPESKIIRQNAIIIADVSETIDDWGHVTFIKFDGTPYINGTHTFAIVCDCETTLKYLFYYFRNDASIKTLRQFLTGVTVFQMSIKSLSSFKLELPPLPTQTRFAEILSAYDDAIENNNRRIVLLEKAARELYREWFVRFRFPGHEDAEFMNGLPEGWDVVSFGSLAYIIDGDRGVNYPKQDEFSPEGYCLFLNAGNVTKNGFDFNSNAFITEEKDKILRKGRLVRNDIVLTTRGTVGNVAFFNKYIPYEVMRINSGMVILRDSSEVSPEFLYITLRSDSIQKMIELYSSGSAQPQLPIKDMRKMRIIKPTVEILSRFTDIVSDMLSQSALLHNQSQNLARQRDLLLPRLMSGKLVVQAR